MPTPQPCDKPSNPKDVIASGKLPLHLWPSTATAMGSIALLNGREKYGGLNFRAGGARASVYIDALMRHALAWFEGEECDPDDGVPHLAAALGCLAILVDTRAHGELLDDRTFAATPGFRKVLDELTPHVDRIRLLHADRNPKHWTIDDRQPLPANQDSNGMEPCSA